MNKYNINIREPTPEAKYNDKDVVIVEYKGDQLEISDVMNGSDQGLCEEEHTFSDLGIICCTNADAINFPFNRPNDECGLIFLGFYGKTTQEVAEERGVDPNIIKSDEYNAEVVPGWES